MAEIIFDYNKAEFENIPCNLCGTDSFFILAKRAANGRRTQTCLCRNCGLIFINPRMTSKWYDIYYQDFYREDREILHGHSDPGGDPERNFRSSRRFGNALGKKLGNFLKSGLTIDVGSSTGGVLFGLKEIIPSLEIFGIEPSLKESSFAEEKGVRTFRGLFENYAKENTASSASNIFCVRSLNHLLDPRKFFQWSIKSLSPNGNLVLYVKNFRYQARRAGSVEAGVQIDHPFMFTPESLKNFVESVGFKVIHLEDDEAKDGNAISAQKKEGMSVHHILLVAQKPSEEKSRPTQFSDRKNFMTTLLQLAQPYLKLYYLAAYSRRTEFLRKSFRR